MALFGSLKNQVARPGKNEPQKPAANSTRAQTAASPFLSSKACKKSFTFDTLPMSLAQLQSLPEASLDDPFKTAALTVLALRAYTVNPDAGIEMLNWLRGPRPLSGHDLSFLKDRFWGGTKLYLPMSYFAGSSPENDYTPARPYKLTIQSTHTSDTEQGYMKLFIPCSGADNPRPIKMRLKPSTGQWFLWEQYLLTDIRQPVSQDPWA